MDAEVYIYMHMLWNREKKENFLVTKFGPVTLHFISAPNLSKIRVKVSSSKKKQSYFLQRWNVKCNIAVHDDIRFTVQFVLGSQILNIFNIIDISVHILKYFNFIDV